jgi:ATP-binding cassette, subfamily B, bacterial PglK
MFTSIKKLFTLLTPKQRSKFYRLQFLVILMTIAEITGIASMGPFMALVGDINILDGTSKLAEIYNMSGIKTKEDFIFWVGMIVLCIMTLASLISIFTTWKLSLFSSQIGVEISNQLYSDYMSQPWLFHTTRNSTQLTKKISIEAGRMATLVISPLLQVGAKLIFTTFMLSVLFIYNPQIAITGFIIFALSYILIFNFIRPKLKKNGKEISNQIELRFKLMAEGFGGIKDILLIGKQEYYINHFILSGEKFAFSQGSNQALATIPKYIMELVAFGSIVFLILFLIKTNHGNATEILPALAIYALAGFKLLPAFQSIYANLSHVRGNIASFEEISKDLENSLKVNTNIKDFKADTKRLVLGKGIEFKNIIFTYPGRREIALNNLNLTIPNNKVIGIVGPSGSGKSTFIDLLLGLIEANSGEILIDDKILNKTNIRSWQNTIGFVPQSIYLSDGSIMENIAIGLEKDEIDKERVMRAIDQAHLKELINSYENGIDTQVGERGVQLSGGQRQRIGIARALYNDVNILVFDEATSALDGITEKLIMDAIHDFSGTKTIVMIAHRLTTVEKCDIIYFLDEGRVTDSGTYEELLNKNITFRKMADQNE